VNASGKVAEDVLVSFGLVDIDRSATAPLPLASQPHPYVNRESGKGPFRLLGAEQIAGHRYFGIVYVGCRGCDALRTYWVFSDLREPPQLTWVERTAEDTYTIDPERLAKDTGRYLDALMPSLRRIAADDGQLAGGAKQ
jgi:hypothetical protein